MNCLNLDNADVQQWVVQESLEKTYQVYVDNNFILPDYNIWKQFNTDVSSSKIDARLDAILPLSKFTIDKLSKLMGSLPISTQAAYLQNVIYLSENPKLVDVYEEGFHAIFDTLVSSVEKKQLLQAAQSILAKRLKVEGSTINKYVKEISEKYPETYSSMSQQQKLDRVFEEELAKMYVNSLQYNNSYGAEKQLELSLIPYLGASLAKSIASILNKAFNVLKGIFKMFNNNRDTISLFFKQINDGRYKHSIVSLNENNTIPSTRLLELDESYYDEDYEMEVINKKLLSPEETQRVIRNVGSIFFQLQHEKIKNKFEERLEESLFQYFDNSDDLTNIYNKDKTLVNEKNQEALKALKEDISSYVKDFNSIVDFDSETVESEEETQNDFAKFDSSADENSPYETSYSRQLKLRIAKAGRIKENSLKVVTIDDRQVTLTFVEAVDVYKTYSAIARALSNTADSKDRWRKLMSFSSLETNSDTKAFVNQLIFDMFKDKFEGQFTKETFYNKVIEESLNKIDKESGFIIFPTQEQLAEGLQTIGINNAVIVNSIVKGFDLWKRTNYVMTYDANNKYAEIYDANINNVRSIQFNTWLNSMLEKSSAVSFETQPLPSITKAQSEDSEKLAKTIKDNFESKGILLSIDYISYSLAKFKQQQTVELTNKELFLVNNFNLPDNLLLDTLTGNNFIEINKAFVNFKIEKITKSDGGGIEGRLKDIAEGNSYFDESIPDGTYKTADGKTKYNFQYKTFHLQRIDEILKSKGILKNTIPNQDFINPEFISKNYILDKLKDPDGVWQKLINNRRIFSFTADGIRQQNVLESGKKEDSDGVVAGDMSNRDFMLYLLNGAVAMPEKAKEVKTTPIYFGNYEASKTYEFINLPFMNDLIDDKGVLKDRGATLIEDEIKKEFDRIKLEATKIINEETDVYTKYNSGKTVLFSVGDKTVHIPYKEKDGVRSVDFSNYRALAFSDYIIGLIGKEYLQLPKDLEDTINIQLNKKQEQNILENVNTENSLLAKALFNEYSNIGIKEGIIKSIEILNKATINKLFNAGVLSTNTQTKAVESTLLDARYNVFNSSMGFISKDIETNVKKVATSNLLNTMYINQLMQGDQALLYKSDGVDMFKRFKMRNAAIVSFDTDTIAPELGIDEVWKEMPFVVHDEIKAKSGINKEDVDQADAQNYGTLKYFRYAQYAMSRLNIDLAQLYDMIDQGEDTSSVETKVFDMELYTPILKTVGFDGSNGVKKSDVLLSKRLTSMFESITEIEAKKHGELINGRWKSKIGATKETVKWSDGSYHEVLPRPEKNTKDAALHDRRKVMEGWRFDNNQWTYTGEEAMLSMPISASKLLNRNTLKGHDLKSLKSKNINYINLKYYGLQVETAHPHDKIPDPTQYLEIALNELKNQLGTSFTIDGKQYNTDELLNMYQEALFQRDDIRFTELYNEIFETDEDGVITFKKEDFKALFVKSLEASGNEKQIIELAQAGQFNNPLLRDKFISQIFSYFTKDGLSQKRKGDAAPHFSSYGMKLIKKAVLEIVNGKEHWSWKTIQTDSVEYKEAVKDDSLKDLSSFDFYPNVDNKPHTRYTENRLQDAIKELGEGVYFIDELRHLKPRVENNQITGYFTEAVLSKYEKEQAIIYDRQRYMFGVRIPSQDKHSGVNIEWVDMLPAHYGSAVAVAKEIVQLSGSDFDIDKLYISKPEGYYTKDGFKQYDNSFEDYVKYQLKNNRALKALSNLSTKDALKELGLLSSEQEYNKEFNSVETLKRAIIKRDIIQHNIKINKITKREESNIPFRKSIKDLIKPLEKQQRQLLEDRGYIKKFQESQLNANKKQKNSSYRFTDVIIEARKNEPLYVRTEEQIRRLAAIVSISVGIRSSDENIEILTDEENLRLIRILNEHIENYNNTYVGKEYKEEFANNLNKFKTKYSNRGYINNLLLQANQQGLANNQTLDGKISDTPASMTYMAEGVLKEFVLADGTTLLSDDGGKTFVGSNKVAYNVHSFMGHVTMHNNVNTGKSNIGIDVNWNLLAIVLHRIGAEINPNNSVTIGDQTYDSLELAIKNNEDLRVFDVNSTLTSSATDEAKEQLNARYGFNIDALGAVLPLVNMGGNLSLAIALVNQPIIKEYLAKKAIKNNAVLTYDEKKDKFKSDADLVEDLIGRKYEDLIETDGVYSISDLAEGIRGNSTFEFELQVLRDFIKLSEITEYGANLIAGIKLKKGFSSDIYAFDSLIEKLDKLDVFKDEEDVTPKPIEIRKALLDTQLTKSKELFGKFNIVNKLNSALPAIINLKKTIFTNIKELLKDEIVFLNKTAQIELNNELESFIYSQLLIKQLQDIADNTADKSILKYLNRELITDKHQDSIESIFIKFKKAVETIPQLTENALLKKLQVTKKNGVVSLTLNQLVKLSDTEMTNLQDAFIYLTNFIEPIEGSISPLEFTKVLQAQFIVKDGMQFKYDGISKIFPTAVFDRFGKILENVSEDKANIEYNDQFEFIKRYMESVKHKASLKRITFNISKDEIEYRPSSKATEKDVIIVKGETISKIIKLDGEKANYLNIGIEFGDNKITYTPYKLVGFKQGGYFYEAFKETGSSNISTMGIPMGQLVFGEVKQEINQSKLPSQKEVLDISITKNGHTFENGLWYYFYQKALRFAPDKAESILNAKDYHTAYLIGADRTKAFNNKKSSIPGIVDINEEVWKIVYPILLENYNFKNSQELNLEVQQVNTEDSYQYYGSIYKIKLENNIGIDVIDYKGKLSSKNTLLENYNSNRDIDPQNGKPFRDMFFKEAVAENKIRLNSEQQIAVDKAVDFINNGNSKEYFLIEGKGGTGKTFSIKEILKHFKHKGIIISALSHKAKGVIRDSMKDSGIKASYQSVAGMLGLTLNMETGEFEKSKDNINSSPIELADIIVVDEASMINEEALNLIMNEKNKNAKVIFMGDIGQLPPIRTEKNPFYKNKKELLDQKSPVFNQATNKVKLLTRMRQGEESPILPFADYYWNNSQVEIPVKDPAVNKQTIINDKGALIFSKDNKEVLDAATELFKEAVITQNPNLVKYVTYKNDNRIAINKYVHNTIFGYDSNVFNKGELIIFNDSFNDIENSTETQIKDVLSEYNDTATKVRILELEATVETKKGYELVTFPVIHPEDISIYNNYVSDLFKTAFSLKGSDKNSYLNSLSKAWEAKNKYAKVDYAYAITSHKSQGSTYDVVIVDEKDIISVNPISNRQKSESIYTAITRAKNITVMLTGSTQDEDVTNLNDLNNKINNSKSNTLIIPEQQSDTIRINNINNVKNKEEIIKNNNIIFNRVKKELDIIENTKIEKNNRNQFTPNLIRILYTFTKTYDFPFDWNDFQADIYKPLELFNQFFKNKEGFSKNDEEFKKIIPAYFGLEGKGLSISVEQEEKNNWYLSSMYLPDFMQNKGIGKSIIDILKYIAITSKSDKRIYIWSEKTATSFWEKQGFVKTGELINNSDQHFFTKNTEPFEVMELFVTQETKISKINNIKPEQQSDTTFEVNCKE